jgi:hypothetical protein
MGAEYEMALAQKDSTNQTLSCFRGSGSPKGCGNVRYFGSGCCRGWCNDSVLDG